MERRFGVKGTPRVNLIFRGMCLEPRKFFEVIMTETEFNSFKEYIEIESVKEVLDTPNPQPQILEEKQPEIVEEPKETNNNGSKKIARTGQNKRTTRK